jgi:hypothetical protein
MISAPIMIYGDKGVQFRKKGQIEINYRFGADSWSAT